MKELLAEIKKSFTLLNPKKGTGEVEIHKANPKSYCRAMELLFNIINRHGEIETPIMSACIDGSIDISFRHKKTPGNNIVRLLINVKETKISWYGHVSNDHEIKGDQEHDLFDPDLFYWVRIHLRK